MSTRDRRGAQLSIELPPELLARLRAHAAAGDRPVAAVVRRWIEAGLSGGLDAAAARPVAGDLEGRVAALEAAVAALQVKPNPRRSVPAPELQPEQLALETPGSPPPVEPVVAPRQGDAITTVELAERTGTSRGAWNNWARGKAPGAVRKMPAEVGNWRLVGEAPAPGGGPLRKLWEPA